MEDLVASGTVEPYHSAEKITKILRYGSRFSWYGTGTVKMPEEARYPRGTGITDIPAVFHYGVPAPWK